MGIYMVPASAVLAHRIYHANGLPGPMHINWQVDVALAQHAPNALGGDAPQDLELASTDQLIAMLHRPGSEPNFSPESCGFCRAEFLQLSVDAELRATQTLKALVPSLTQVRWMGWFTHRHLGTNSYTI